MKYSQKVSIIPFDKYQRLLEQVEKQAFDEIESNKQITSNDNKEIEQTQDEGDLNKTSGKFDVTSVLPSDVLGDAKLLLNYLSSQNIVSWNEHGQLTINGKVIENTNIAEIILDAVSDSSSNNSKPLGITEF